MTDEPRPDRPDAAAPPASVPEGASSTPGVPPLPPTAFPHAAPQQPGGAHPVPAGAPQDPSGGGQPWPPYATQPPAPYATAAPGAAQPPWGAPGVAASPPRTLSALSLIAGLVGLTTTLVTFGLTVVVAIAGVVLGHLASRREPASRGLWLAGLVTGYVGVLATICLWVGLLAFWLAFGASSAGAFGR